MYDLTTSWLDRSRTGGRPLAASIVIVSKDRREDLRTAIGSALGQTADAEVLVIDDGSRDGTSAMVQSEFPEARLVRSEEPRGYIHQRNRAAELARGEVIFSLDDDAEFSSTQTVARTLEEFGHPRVAAVAIPFFDARKSPDLKQSAPTATELWVTNTYIGTAHAVRRDVFFRLGGYRESLHHLFEEPDLCMRLLREGFVVRLGNAEPIYHYESPKRNFAKHAYYVLRNHLLMAWYHAPLPSLLLRIAELLLYAPWLALRARQPRAVARGLLTGARDCRADRAARAPLSRREYRIYRRLRRSRALRLAEIEEGLPAPAAVAAVLAPG